MQKTNDFLTQLLDPARAKILRLFVLYDKELFLPTDIAQRAGVSATVASKELGHLMRMGLVKEIMGEGVSERARKKGKRYVFNERNKYANALSAFIHEVSPAEYREVEKALRGAGRLNAIVLSGIFIGDMRRPADLIVVGDSVNEKRLEKVVRSLEPKYGREIRYTIFSTPEFRYRMTINDKLLRDTLDYPHRLLLNKNNLI